MRLFTLCLLILIALTQHRLWQGNNGVFDYQHTKSLYQEQVAVNDQLQQRNRRIRERVDDLKMGWHAIEAHARRELGMIKKDETFFRIIVDGRSSESHGADEAKADN